MRQFHTFVGMNTDFVMTNEDIIEMKEKLKDVKSTGLQGTYLAQTLDNLRKASQQKRQLQTSKFDWL